MSTPDTPATPPLTRRQLRELRQTGATPIITPQQLEGATADAVSTPDQPAVIDAVPSTDDAAPADGETVADQAAVTPDEPEHAESAHAVASHDEPEHAESAHAEASHDEPEHAESAQDEPERAESAHDEPEQDDSPAEEPERDSSPAQDSPRSAGYEAYGGPGAELGVTGLTRRQARAQEKIRTAAVPVISPDLEPAPAHHAATSDELDPTPAIFRPAPVEADTTEAPAPSVVNPALGSELLGGATPEVSLPASFDQLISRNTGATGTVSTPNALILSQTPTGVPLVGPINATGEVMITGTFELPEGLGSVGHAPGTTDGHDADAVLLDGELPPASSPTPIAASAAISTVKQPGDIIRPPAPEKGSKLLVGLIITTGALALLVAVSLGFAITTGVFR